MDRLLPVDVDSILKDIQTDVHSGATEITRKAAHGLLAYSQSEEIKEPDYSVKLILLGRAIIEAQPTMASLFNLVNDVLLNTETVADRESLESLRQATRQAVHRFLISMESGLEAIAKQGQVLITSGHTVFTHSSSATVIGILRNAVQQGKTVQAIATESRPHCEGRELGRNLGQQGISTRVVLDAAIGQYVKEADLVIVGADRVAEESFTNKVGTLTLAMAAREAQIPFYVACQTNKFLPASVVPMGEVHRLSEQHQGEEWMNVDLVYSLFEEIPNAWLSGIITEQGIISMNALAKSFRAFRVCGELLPQPAETH